MIACVRVRGKLYVPEPAEPTHAFFWHLVELGDEARLRGAYVEAREWYELAHTRIPEGVLDEQQADTVAGFVRRAALVEDQAMAAQLARAACWVVSTACVTRALTP